MLLQQQRVTFRSLPISFIFLRILYHIFWGKSIVIKNFLKNISKKYVLLLRISIVRSITERISTVSVTVDAGLLGNSDHQLFDAADNVVTLLLKSFDLILALLFGKLGNVLARKSVFLFM